jgi:hypothetical protein
MKRKQKKRLTASTNVVTSLFSQPVNLPQMLLQVILPEESIRTPAVAGRNKAKVRPDTSVDPLMSIKLKFAVVRAGAGALGAGVRPRAAKD